MNKSRHVATAAGVLGLLSGALLWAGDAHAQAVSRGQLLAAMCETCHGTDGHGSKPIKPINEMDVDEFLETMKAFASKEEPSTMMYRHAPGYTDEELEAMAEYLKDR